MAAPSKHRPTGIKAPHGAHTFQIGFADGQGFSIPHRALRGYCPCAGCQGHGGTIRFVEPDQGGAGLDLLSVTQVGNYAVQLSWGDRHDSGIYSFSYLRQLGELCREHGERLEHAVPTLPRGPSGE